MVVCGWPRRDPGVPEFPSLIMVVTHYLLSLLIFLCLPMISSVTQQTASAVPKSKIGAVHTLKYAKRTV